MSEPLRRPDYAAIAVLLLLTVAIYLLLMDLPLYGDAWGYGYRSARWMADNGLPAFAAGAGRGEQAMGHPPLFYWLWAVLMLVLGNTVQVSHILPALAGFAALWGCYRITLHFSRCSLTAFLASLALLATPTFLANLMNPLPETAMAAASVWALLAYARGEYARTAIFTALALLMREQAVVLVATLVLVEAARGGLRRPGRLALLCSPALVLVAVGLGNLAYNGFFFMGSYVKTVNAITPSVLLERMELFMGHIYAGGFRWLPVTLAVALFAEGRRRLGLPAALALLSPALLWPPWEIRWLALMALLAVWGLRRSGRVPDRPVLAVALFPLLLALLHVLIVLVSADPNLNLLRYVLAGVPLVIGGTLSMVRRIGGKGMAAVTATVLAAAALSQNADVPMLWQPETTLSSVHQAYVRRSAYLIASAKGDTLLLPEINLYKMADPGLGYVQAPYPARPIGADLAVDVSYTAVLEPYRPEERAFLDSLQRWNGATHEIVLDTCVIREPFRADVFRLIPRSG